MNGNVLKTVALISAILLFVCFLSACKTVKGSIGFQWGQGPDNDRYREAENIQKESCPDMDIEQIVTVGIVSPPAHTRPFAGPA